MTEKEAFDKLTNLVMDYVISGRTNVQESEVGIWRLALIALEKQIPKKLFVEKVEGTKIYYCPYCTEKLMEIGFANIKRQVLIPGRPPHCYKCGQRLDWEATNDTDKD